MSGAGILCFQEMNNIEEYYRRHLKSIGYELYDQANEKVDFTIAIALKTSEYTLLDLK